MSFDKDLVSFAWSPIKYQDETGLIKFKVNETSYQFMFCDFSSIFQEDLTLAEAKSRCSKLNEGLEMSDKKLITQVEAVFTKIQDGSLNVQVESKKEDMLSFTLTCPFMADMLFNWQLHLHKKPSNHVKLHLTLPMLGYISGLRSTINSLFAELHRKDKELEDFRFQGYSLRRKHLKTTKFNQEDWEEKISSADWVKESLHSYGIEKVFTDGVYTRSIPPIVEFLGLLPQPQPASNSTAKEKPATSSKAKEQEAKAESILTSQFAPNTEPERAKKPKFSL